MVKRIVVGAVVVGMLVGVVAYFKVERVDRKKVRNVEFQVVEEENIPGEVMDEISGYGKELKWTSYLCSDEMYIVVYYGEQSTDGYSIEVNKLYESENAIFVLRLANTAGLFSVIDKLLTLLICGDGVGGACIGAARAVKFTR